MIVCICHRGNVRSATCATVLRDFFGIPDVIATGLDTTTADTLRWLCEGHTVLLVGDAGLLENFSKRYSDLPFQHVNIGPDKWGLPMHPELVAVLLQQLLQHNYKPVGFYNTPENYAAAHRLVWLQRGLFNDY